MNKFIKDTSNNLYKELSDIKDLQSRLNKICEEKMENVKDINRNLNDNNSPINQIKLKNHKKLNINSHNHNKQIDNDDCKNNNIKLSNYKK